MNTVEHISWQAADFWKVHKNLGRILDKLQLRDLHTVIALKIFPPRVFFDLILGKIWSLPLKPLCTQLKQIGTKLSEIDVYFVVNQIGILYAPLLNSIIRQGMRLYK